MYGTARLYFDSIHQMVPGIRMSGGCLADAELEWRMV
jgi:hypothetical protein